MTGEINKMFTKEALGAQEPGTIEESAFDGFITSALNIDGVHPR
ncbi:MAG: hypothetical protein AAF549_07515 [Pseudomonadota bacterium]